MISRQVQTVDRTVDTGRGPTGKTPFQFQSSTHDELGDTLMF
jgi:hypothetical protein